MVVAGKFVPKLLVIAGALVISTDGRLLSMSLVDGLFVFVELFPQPTRNMIVMRGMNIFINEFVVEDRLNVWPEINSNRNLSGGRWVRPIWLLRRCLRQQRRHRRTRCLGGGKFGCNGGGGAGQLRWRHIRLQRRRGAGQLRRWRCGQLWRR